MSEVCFINPPRPWLVHPHAQAPIGILYLAAVLEEAGHAVKVYNWAGQPPDPTHWRIPAAEVYCLTGTWLDVPMVNALAVVIHDKTPSARILAGGPIALSEDELNEDINVVVRGEAELDICALVAPEAGFQRTHICTPPTDLDALPFPARHLWPGPFGGNIFIGGRNYFGGGSTTILTSRGCPHKCAFCASQALAPRKVRFRNAESVVEEMERCVVDYGVRQFRFSDENFNAKSAHVTALCQNIMASDILGHGDGIAWRTSIAVKPRSHEMFQAMRLAGCKEVSIGIESGDPKVLALLCHEKIRCPRDAMGALGMAQESGLLTRALMMCGTPGENAETARLNAPFFTSPNVDALALATFAPMPGSDIYNRPELYGCSLRSEMASRGQYLYGPNGRNDPEPAITIDDFPFDALRQSMATQVAAAEATGKIGKG